MLSHQTRRMSAVAARAACALALLAVVAPAAGAQTGAQAILAYLEQVRHQTGAPGITAAVAVDGEIVFSGGVGYAELDNQTPADGATVLNVGSTDVLGRSYISKTGTVRGTRSVVINYPDHGLVVALQGNIAPFPVLQTGQAIAQMFLPPAHAR